MDEIKKEQKEAFKEKKKKARKKEGATVCVCTR